MKSRLNKGAEMKSVVLILIVCCVAACGRRGSEPIAPSHVTVTQILLNPELVGRKVMVRGKVTATIGVGPLGSFELADASGTIRVLSAKALPLEGDEIELKGTPRQAFVAGRRREIVLIATTWKKCAAPAENKVTTTAH